MSLDGTVGVVTGAGSGIGKSIAVALAKAGAHVVIADLSEPAGLAAVRAIEAIGGKAVLQRTDVSRREDARQLIEATVDQFGRVDTLVNNAGLQHVVPIQDFPEEKWDLLIGVMMTGAFLLSKYAFAHDAPRLRSDHQYRFGSWPRGLPIQGGVRVGETRSPGPD